MGNKKKYMKRVVYVFLIIGILLLAISLYLILVKAGSVYKNSTLVSLKSLEKYEAAMNIGLPLLFAGICSIFTSLFLFLFTFFTDKINRDDFVK